MGSLIDYEVQFYCPTVTPYKKTSLYSSMQLVVPMLDNMEFTVEREGGMASGKFELFVKDEDLWREDGSGTWRHIFDLGVVVYVQIQAGNESGETARYHGIVDRITRPTQTDPRFITVNTVGARKYLQDLPVVCVEDDIKVKAAFLALLGAIPSAATPYLSTTHTDLITHDPDITIAKFDALFDRFSDVCDDLCIAAQPNATWGITARETDAPDVSRRSAALYFSEISDVALDLGFAPGASRSIENLEAWYERKEIVNGVIGRCQARCAGGDLILYVAPSGLGSYEPWRIKDITIPQAVEPADGLAYLTQYVAARADQDAKVTFKAIDYGERPYANNVINAPIKIPLFEGATALEIVPAAYTVTVDSNGAINTTFDLGKSRSDPLTGIAPELQREIHAAQSSIIWTARELDASKYPIIRTWRRHAASQSSNKMVSFWHGAMTNHKNALMDYDAFAEAGVDVPSGWPDYGWEYNAERSLVVGVTQNEEGVLMTPRIDLGFAVSKARVYVDQGPGILTKEEPELFSMTMWDEPDNDVNWFWTDICGLSPYLIACSDGGTWRAAIVTNPCLTTGCPELPVKVMVHRPNHSNDTSDVTTYGGMASASRVGFVVFGSTAAGASQVAYALAIHRSASSDTCHVALGWYDAGTFRSDWWTTGAVAAGTSCGSIDLGTFGDIDDSITRLEIVAEHLPTGSDKRFIVKVRDGRTKEELWDSSDVHGASLVDAPTSVHLPETKRMAGIIWHSFGNTGVDDEPFGLKHVEYTNSASIDVAITRNGSTWDTDTDQALLSPGGDDEWDDGTKGIMVAAKLQERVGVVALGIAFRSADEP